MYYFQTKLLKLNSKHFESYCSQSFFKNLSFIFTICVQVFGLHVGSCTICVQCPQMPEKGVRATRTGITDSLGAGSKTRVPWKSNQCSQPPSHLSSPENLLQISIISKFPPFPSTFIFCRITLEYFLCV